jgi:phosphodiesterase/alkaline phosphatase D-like protein
MNKTHGIILATLTTLGLSLAAQAGPAAAASKPVPSAAASPVVTQTTAMLTARIQTDEETTSYHFEYGTTTSYGASSPSPDGQLSAGTEAVAVEAQLTGLQPDTTYHYRVHASNALGETTSTDETFITLPVEPPGVSTGQATAIAQTSATLTATIDTQGYETTYEFDLGADTSYGSRIFGDAGNEPGTQTFTVPLQDLAPGTTYHYRIQATNEFGTNYGPDVSFTTATFPTATLTAPSVEPLVPSLLLTTATTAHTGPAKAAAVKPLAVAARHRVRRVSARMARERKQKAGNNRNQVGGADRGGRGR